MKIYCADCRGEATNCRYPHEAEITDEASLRDACRSDYVCALYKNGYRSGANFLKSDCLGMDFDNDHSEEPEKWITPEQIREALPGVTLAFHYSRNHMKKKNGKPARPKFHLLAAIDPVECGEEYKDLKLLAAEILPFADMNALDAARFFFGTENPEVEFYPGTRTLNAVLNEMNFDAGLPQGTYGDSQMITEGRRNATLSRRTGKIVKRFGYNEKAYEIFLREAAKCVPPLPERELATIWRSAGRTAEWARKQPGYIPPEEYNAAGSLKPSDYSDIGQAKVIATDCANELLFTPGTDFPFYNRGRWEESKEGATGRVFDFLDRQLEDSKNMVDEATRQLVERGLAKNIICLGGKTLEKQIQENQREAYEALLAGLAYKAFVMKRRDMKYVTAAMNALKSMVRVDINELDAQENLLNCPDGTYDLVRGTKGRRDHSPTDLITKMTAVSPGEEGRELWQDTLDLIFRKDSELIEYVQRIVGLAAIGEVYQEAIIISYGDGSNGKSTFWNTIAAVLGDYAGLISADTLTVGCHRNVKPELAEAKGRRLLIASELEEGMRLSTSIVKQLSSTDLIEAEKKYKDPFKFRPTHTLVLYTNHLPKVGAMDTGIWRRLIVIPFTARISGSSEHKNYGKYLQKHAGPAVLKWIMEGAEKVIRDNYHLTPPACVADACQQYREDNDWLAHFLEECCKTGGGLQEKSGELYSAYRAFAARNNEFARSTIFIRN